jgi:hypothetical protein
VVLIPFLFSLLYTHTLSLTHSCCVVLLSFRHPLSSHSVSHFLTLTPPYSSGSVSPVIAERLRSLPIVCWPILPDAMAPSLPCDALHATSRLVRAVVSLALVPAGIPVGHR